MTNWEPKQLQTWHHRVIDMLIADPTLTAEQISIQLNCNIGKEMITLLRRTEMFRLALEERRQQISSAVDTHTIDRLNGKLTKLAEVAVDTVTEQLERERATATVGVTEASLQTCEMVLKNLGYGRPANPQAPTTQVNVLVNASDIAQAQQLMRAAHARTLDSEPARALPPALAVRAG